MLSASTGYIDGLNNLLKALLPVSNYSSISITRNGLLVNVVEKSKSCSAYTLLVTSLFSSYELGDQDVDTISVSLKSLVSCLQMYSTWKTSSNASTRVTLQYDGSEKLRLSCGLENIRSQSELQIYANDSATEMGPEIDKSNIIVQIICAGSLISEMIKVIDKLGTTKLGVSGQKNPVQSITFQGSGVGTSTSFRYMDESVEALVIEELFNYEYDFKSILKLRESLRSTSQLNIRCDMFGVMNIQMIHDIDDQTYVIDYLFSPIE